MELRTSESFVVWAQQCFFRKQGLVPGGCGVSIAVSSDWCPGGWWLRWAVGVQGWNLALPWLGWAHAGNNSNTKESLPLPFQVKQDLIGFTFPNIKHKLNLSQKSILKQDCSSEYSPVLLNAVLLQCPCYGEGRCWGEELKNVKQTVFKKQLLRWLIQICCLVLDLFIAIGFTCDIVCSVTSHPSW